MGHFEPGEVQSFGGWVESRRRAMNLTRVELAVEVGCAPVTIKKIERDERRPSRQMAELLAKRLAVSPMDRDLFMRMARGVYADRANVPQMLLRIPPYLEQDALNPPSSTANFVERRKELARLQTCLDQALGEKATPIFLLGDAGSGKTSLMREFARIAQQTHPGLLIAGGQCNAQTGQGDPFRPFRDILGILTGDFEIDWTLGMFNREQALQVWASIPTVVEAITTSGPHLLDTLLPVSPLVHRLAPYLAENTDWFNGLQSSAHAGPSATSGSQQAQVMEEMTRVFRAITRQNPLLLIVDDLQWADRSSLDLLFHLGRRLTGSRLLLLGSYRTGGDVTRQPTALHDADGTPTPETLMLELARQYGDIQIRLDQAGPAEGRAFIDAIIDLEPNQLGEAFRESLFLHTRGHPLFTVETLQSMRQNRNILLDGAGYWVVNTSATPTPLPARIEAVIEQRLAFLNPLLKEVLNVASVEGEGFAAEVVARVLGLDVETVLKSFTYELGQQHHLIEEQGHIQIRSLRLNRFQFQHMLIQEHLYSRLVPGERRRLHRKIAEELEKTLIEPETGGSSDQKNSINSEKMVPPEYLDEFGPSLLRHFWLSEEWTRAAVYAHQLGIRAGQRYAMREAIGYYEQALLSLGHQAKPQAALIFDVLLAWQEAAFNFKPYEDQLKQLSRAAEIARDLHDKPRLIQAMHWTANVLLAHGRWSEAGPALAECLSLAEELGNEELSVRPVYFKALMTTFANPAEALKWIARAEALSIKYNDLRFQAYSLATHGQVLAQLGEFPGAQKSIERARQVSGQLASPLVESDVDLFAAWASLAMGNMEKALEYSQRSVDRAIATDNMDCICSGLVCIGYTNLELGRVPEAAAAFEQGIERSDISGAMIYKLNGQAGLAMTQFISGHPEATGNLEEVVANMLLYEDRIGAANANHLLGICLMQLGESERAGNCLNQAADFYRQSGMHPFLARTLASMAELKDKQGQAGEAQGLRAEAESLRASPGNAH
jgi:tetratricopeptide (TPR) repeat protein/transcriptional regulator with XRE-family HTH domain